MAEPKFDLEERLLAEAEARANIFGPTSAPVPGVGSGVSPESSERLSAGRREQHAGRVRSPETCSVQPDKTLNTYLPQ